MESSSSNTLSYWDLKPLIMNELTQAKDLLKQLQNDLDTSSTSTIASKLLVTKVICSFDNSVSMLNRIKTDAQPTAASTTTTATVISPPGVINSMPIDSKVIDLTLTDKTPPPAAASAYRNQTTGSTTAAAGGAAGSIERPASIFENNPPRSDSRSDYEYNNNNNNNHPRSDSRSDYESDIAKDQPKKRKVLPRWTENVRVCEQSGLEGPLDDGYNWKKYGQKDILGAKYPRGYYRCTHRNVQGCIAIKQVQRSDKDPSYFTVTYQGRHTCTQASEDIPRNTSRSKHDQLNKCQDPKQKKTEVLISFQTSSRDKSVEEISFAKSCQVRAKELSLQKPTQLPKALEISIPKINLTKEISNQQSSLAKEFSIQKSSHTKEISNLQSCQTKEIGSLTKDFTLQRSSSAKDISNQQSCITKEFSIEKRCHAKEEDISIKKSCLTKADLNTKLELRLSSF
ncbi:hypothetical protein C5167_014246 [Papaver somniferum]|uniref:WRKY domain-containing protein n=1 Tax=Papaver somniferum TaxID=3469 RepID=A0A4Y7J3K7_PAPSO|nr:probable WRKY transcription factor 53 [Papaver somniferum]RZC55397.1 hypothetical protein C5167_014246 [Papaver somniferum]